MLTYQKRINLKFKKKIKKIFFKKLLLKCKNKLALNVILNLSFQNK